MGNVFFGFIIKFMQGDEARSFRLELLAFSLISFLYQKNGNGSHPSNNTFRTARVVYAYRNYASLNYHAVGF